MLPMDGWMLPPAPASWLPLRAPSSMPFKAELWLAMAAPMTPWLLMMPLMAASLLPFALERFIVCPATMPRSATLAPELD